MLAIQTWVVLILSSKVTDILAFNYALHVHHWCLVCPAFLGVVGWICPQIFMLYVCEMQFGTWLVVEFWRNSWSLSAWPWLTLLLSFSLLWSQHHQQCTLCLCCHGFCVCFAKVAVDKKDNPFFSLTEQNICSSEHCSPDLMNVCTHPDMK